MHLDSTHLKGAEWMTEDDKLDKEMDEFHRVFVDEPQNGPRTDAALRALHISAPEDVEIEELCERVGYGAVMDAAARLWAKKDPRGAFYIGGCLGLDSLNDLPNKEPSE
eukprot:GHVR01126314.1.p1 GENE.GHVR01126314.1~~GHVR01126314.1.p1  ORF type:complete len:109 (-),score=18.73 GHVR01126314.1:300-626(-)